MIKQMEEKRQIGTRVLRRGSAVIVLMVALMSIQVSKACGVELRACGMQGCVAEEDTLLLVDQMPQFPGGWEALKKYCTLVIEVAGPAPKHDHGIPGHAIVQFIIDEDGRALRPRIMRSIDPYLDKVALQAIDSMPKWTPGMHEGKKRIVRYTVPVRFRIEYNKK